MYMAGVPCHVVQRGNNREVCFFAPEDYLFYLECLGDACSKYHVACHAYVLMTNHVHLLLSPSSVEGISLLMQSIGRRYVQYVNKTYQRCGTLWESRHKASLIDAESYLLSCYRYIELNPVAAGMVDHPGAYKWSSYHSNAWGIEDGELILPHELYLSLGNDQEDRLRRYRELFSISLPKDLVHEIQISLNFSMPLGNERFKAQIESALERSIGHAKRGRPVGRKSKDHE